MTELWQQTTPNNEKIYKNMNKRLKGLKNQTKSKSFNYKLLGRIVGVSFLASYLKYLLYREVSDIEIFSWLSDRDAITYWQDEIYLDIYHVMSHCLIANKLSQEEANKAKEISLQNVGQEMFYDALNRVADFFCGAIADFNYIDGRVTKDKQVTLMEEVISDNEFLIILNISEKGVACIRHEKMN